MQVEELTAVRQTLQADLETSIRRIVDLQAALEEVESSDESETERCLDSDRAIHSLYNPILVFILNLSPLYF